MRHDRRSILKAMGTASVGTVVAVGSASGEESGECHDVVQSATFAEACLEEFSQAGERTPVCGPPFVPQGVLAGPDAPGYTTDSLSIDDGAFEDATFETRRVVATAEFSSPDPHDPLKYVEVQQNTGGGWEYVGGTSATDSTIEVGVVEGDAWDGDGANAGTAWISGGTDYRLMVRTGDHVVDGFEATIEVQTFDENC